MSSETRGEKKQENTKKPGRKRHQAVTLHARNPAKNFKLGGNHLAFTSVGGPAYCSDLDRGKRRGIFEEACEYLKLVQSLDIIHQEGGGHFFGVEHTMSRYETAFYQPILTEQRNFETWEEAGSLDAQMRANRIRKQLLTDYQQPMLDPAIDEELTEYVARRKASLQ